ncbi:hypothetical protein [Streptomyces sp. NPDC048191]|uniref:hypothetical protein n=1 Tax=Streptomyces sp. NPDC048191 TaxID=3155484 RepID=UPI0033F4742A
MPASETPKAVVARLFQQIQNETWPAHLNTAERAGIDLVMLDADIAGCVTTWLSNNGFLDARRLAILRRKLSDLEQVLPELDEADNLRLWQLWHQVAQLVSETVRHSTN